MRKIFTLIFIFSFVVSAFAQDPISVSLENKANGSAVGSLALVSGNSVFLNSFEVKVKKENTPTTGGFYSFVEGVNFLTTTSEFKVLDWSGKSEAGSWSADGIKYTRTITNSVWQKAAYKVELQLFNKNGNVGNAIVSDWLNYSSKEVTAVYTAENCTVARDSTTGNKWKSEAKIKFTTPTTKTTGTFTKATDSDSVLVTIKDVTNNKTVLRFKYAVSWADPATFGININATFSNPANGTFFNPTEKMTATIELKNDKGDLLKLNETATNKVEKLNVWISGPKQSYKILNPFKDIKLVDAYTLKTVTGFNATNNTYEVTLHDSLQLTPGTYTMLIRAKRKGYGPELEKYYLKDFQVKQAQLTTNPNESWYGSCNVCHTPTNRPLIKHNATEVKQCIVCHNVSLTGKELVTIIHKAHAPKGIKVCSLCHTNNAGMTKVTKLACTSCHTGSYAKALPTSHTSFTDATCNGCHSSGNLSPINSHANIAGIESDGTIPTKNILEQNYPNPFNPSTVIKFSLIKNENVVLEIFNILGERVSLLINQNLNAGNYSYTWNASNLSSGIYIYRLKTESFSFSKKMILMR